MAHSRTTRVNPQRIRRWTISTREPSPFRWRSKPLNHQLRPATSTLIMTIFTTNMFLRVCLKNGNWPAAVLLPVRFVGPLLTAHGGYARNVPPRAQPKSLAAAHFRFFRQTLKRKTPPKFILRRRLRIKFLNQVLTGSIFLGVITSLPSFSTTVPVTVTSSAPPPQIGSWASLETSFCLR